MRAALLPILMAMLCCLSMAQYDSPTPPRPVIPGAIPAPRPQIRRIQGPAGGRALPQGVVRVRRPPAARPRPLPLEVEEEEEDFAPLRSAPPPLPPGLAGARPLPAGLAGARPLPIDQTRPPPEASLPPRPVEEPDYDALELEVSNPSPSAPPPPSATPAPAPARPQGPPPPAFRPQGPPPPAFRPQRPAFRPERPLPPAPRPQQDDIPVPSRQQFRQQSRPRPAPEPQYAPQPQSAPRRPPPQAARQRAPEQQYTREQRPRKPVAQVIQKYRDDNPDGSITWGYENDDGTFKEETIGVDCMVRGKYGYIDPDGVKREYTYTSGIPCNKDKERENEGFIDYQNNKYVLANGDSIDLQASIKNKARRPVSAPISNYRN